METILDRLLTGGVQFLVILLAISVHEAAHAWVAWRLGDPTAREAGRTSLHPRGHLEPIGSLLVPLWMIVLRGPVFGWGKPTPVDDSRLTNGHSAALRVLLGGPAANIGLAILSTVGLALAVRVLGEPAGQSAFLTLTNRVPEASHLPGFPIVFTLVQLSYINYYMAAFHLLPVLPLDGGQLVYRLLPSDWALRFARTQSYGLLIALGLALLHVVGLLLLPVTALLALIVSW